MAITCLNNFIGVRSECLPNATAPESGLYINDLPGIDLATAGDIANPEYANGYAFINDHILPNSAQDVAYEIGAVVSPMLRILPLLEADHVGDFISTDPDDNDYLAVNNTTRGVLFCTQKTNMAKIHISTIDVLTNTTINGKTVNVGGTDYSVDLTAGEVATIDVDQTFELYQNKMLVSWNTSDVSVDNTALVLNENCTSCKANKTTSKKSYANLAVYGYDAGTYTGRTYGLKVNFSLICDHEEIVCKLKKQLAKAFQLKAGILFLNEHIYSKRFNAITGLYRDDAKELKAEYTAEYEKLLKTFAGNASIVLSRFGDACIQCKGSRLAVARL